MFRYVILVARTSNKKGNNNMKKLLTVGVIAALLSLGGCKLVNADGECTGLCGPICNDISGSTCLI